MTKLFKKILSLTLTLLTVASLCTGVLASEVQPDISFGRDDASVAQITFTKGKNAWTNTDLFDNFKGIMPGDTKTQDITLTNKTGEDTLHVSLTIIPHDTVTNLVDADALDGKSVAATWTDENGNQLTGEALIAKMNEFLSYMTFTIFQEQRKIVSFKGDDVANIGVELCTIAKGKDATITVQLEVDPNMGNEFANKAAEIDWKFVGLGQTFNELTVQKKWKDSGYHERLKDITVKLIRIDKDGKKEVCGTQKLTSSMNWTYCWSGLSDEYTWTVEEDVPAGYNEPTYSQSGSVVTITNYRSTPWVPPFPPETEPPETEPPETEPRETEPVETEPETKPVETEPEETEPPVIEEPEVRDLTVVKNWAEDKAEDRPTSVSVSLYKGDTEVEKVTLGAWNNWTYTWYDLDANEQWSVLEVEIPLGYTPTYAADGDTVTITNNAILIQTGQLNWPIPVFGGIGVLLIGAGVLLLRKKKENHNA